MIKLNVISRLPTCHFSILSATVHIFTSHSFLHEHDNGWEGGSIVVLHVMTATSGKLNNTSKHLEINGFADSEKIF